ncbi:hypothetical protein NMY22_g8302 [Coprinellus aureogranulatus]|nr:hypothetical protein NMY22_g8302 [Coprinellus aureogranulatus]
MLRPYILNGTRPDASDASLGERTADAESRYAWAKPIYQLCATLHTQYFAQLRLTPSESLLVRSMRGVEREICRVLVGIWAEGVGLGLDSGIVQKREGEEVAKTVLENWRNTVKRLMGWLDWDVWVKCRPGCAFGEICYIPTWVFFPPPEDEKGGEWIKKPEPRCWERVHPLPL